MAVEHDLGFRIRNPQLAITDEITQSFMTERSPLLLPGWEQAALFQTVHRIAAEEPGSYGIEVLIDGVSKMTVTISVRVQPTPPS
jgi:hypothetical protein